MVAIILNSRGESEIISVLISKIVPFVFLLPIACLAESFSGRVIDQQQKPLVNVQVLRQGSQQGTTTDENGIFILQDITPGEHFLHFSLMGYAPQSKRIQIPADEFFAITLEQSVIQLSEIVVSGTMVTDRGAPITYSVLSSEAISDKHAVQDIPSLLIYEPGIYVSNDGGSGFGDSQIMIRGFDEKRLQVMVNNIPVNDPETKEVSWSNWSALPEATQTIQVQRGVGTSLYGTGAIGGSINIVTLDASSQKSLKTHFTVGQFGLKKISLNLDSGRLPGQRSLLLNLGYLEGSGWRENSFQRGLQYYLAFTQRFGTEHLFKAILHGSPQYHTLARASLSAASYASPDQFIHDSLRVDGWGYPAFGFGMSFNGNVHVAAADLSEPDRQHLTSLLDAVFMRSKIGAAPTSQVGGYTIAGDRASMNSNVSHRPQLELHHNWYFHHDSKLTTTVFFTKGLDYSDDVYPAWYIPRQADGLYNYATINNRNYWFSEQVFEYRYYSDFNQLGMLSALSTNFRGHEFSLGLESRRWSARHAGEVLNTFGQNQVGVPIGSVIHPLSESDLFYDFTTSKPQTTVFGHALWQFGQFQFMANVQYSRIRFRVQEQIPSNNNYPDYLDPLAPLTHGGKSWEGSASWDHDNDSLTAEIPVTYSLWDYSKSFQYMTPRLGLSYRLTPELSMYANYSVGVKEPEIKHFYAYGAPQDDLELEKTNDFEVGLKYQTRSSRNPLSLGVTYYNIDFAGKLMQITLPAKANTPGYDYAGHTFVPVGDALYTGLEFSGSFQLASGWSLQSSLSQSKNTWGEPSGSEGAQKLYANVAIAHVDYDDLNGNGIWDEGGSEQALHRNFVKKYHARYDVGMPQFIWNSILGYSAKSFSSSISLRYFRDLYILENNTPVLMGAGVDDLYFTLDDEFSATLPSAVVADLRTAYSYKPDAFELKVKLQVQNVFNVNYWQRGDEFGLIPGGARTLILGLDYSF